ncbi:MAG: DUF881 domain-containing protein [Propionibacteriaceae bacterium]
MTEPAAPPLARWWERGRRALLRARARQRIRLRGRSPWLRLLTAFVCLVAGLMVVVSALNARGTDLRPGRNTDLVGLVQSESRRNAELARRVTDLRGEVDTLSADAARSDSGDTTARALARAAQRASTTAVTGPAVTVSLDDAPATVAANGIDQDLLVVHQQDIQAVANIFWAAGAEAMTIQGQRVISTTGIKCVGNTVVLHGIPYAPPYVISAIGDPTRLRTALQNAEFIRIYQQYVQAYGLGYTESQAARAEFPAYQGTLLLRYARVDG